MFRQNQNFFQILVGLQNTYYATISIVRPVQHAWYLDSFRTSARPMVLTGTLDLLGKVPMADGPSQRGIHLFSPNFCSSSV